jgi:quercetin dioxygenase-like cupin family protein
MRRARLPLALLTLLMIVLTLPGVALAQGRTRGDRIVTWTVTHGPISATLVTPGSDGHQVGDVRAFSFPVEVDRRRATGWLDATLTTTAVDAPGPGDEVRLSLLVFSFGEDRASQVSVEGSSVYPAAGATIGVGTSTVRPVTGGSGRFAGATGWAQSSHLGDGTWRHELHLLVPRIGEWLRGRRPDRSTPAPLPSATPVVTREDLGTTLPDTAPGQRLGLWRVTIPVGAGLPPHWHPGYQLARIETGTLRYTVITGSLVVILPDGATRTVEAGATYDITAGTTVVEQPGAEHAAANAGDVPVDIVLATLFEDGAEPAILVDGGTIASSPAPSASPVP